MTVRGLAGIAACAVAVGAPAGAAASVGLVNLTSPVTPGSAALLVARISSGRPLCTIVVHYKSGPSHAKGLTPKRPSAGIVSWAWVVGSNTTPGNWRVVVSCGAAGRLATVLTVR